LPAASWARAWKLAASSAWAAADATALGRDPPTAAQETWVTPIASADTAILTAALLIMRSTPLTKFIFCRP
jgi:hypothetical protein